MPILSVFANVMLLLCINKFVYKLNIHKSMEYTVIGTAVSYLLYIISLFAYLILAVFFSLIKLPKIIIPASIIVGIFQLIMSFLIFKIKRFSKGLPFLSVNDNSTDFDVYISTFVLCIIILLNADFYEVITISFFVAVLIIFGLVTTISWNPLLVKIIAVVLVIIMKFLVKRHIIIKEKVFESGNQHPY